MSRATETALGELHSLVARVLSGKLTGGDCTAADINAAIKFLKDNNITATPEGSPALAQLQQDMDELGGVDDADLQAALDAIAADARNA